MDPILSIPAPWLSLPEGYPNDEFSSRSKQRQGISKGRFRIWYMFEGVMHHHDVEEPLRTLIRNHDATGRIRGGGQIWIVPAKASEAVAVHFVQ